MKYKILRADILNAEGKIIWKPLQYYIEASTKHLDELKNMLKERYSASSVNLSYVEVPEEGDDLLEQDGIN